MALDKFGEDDARLGKAVASGTGTAFIPAVMLADSAGNITAYLGAGTDKSGSITAGGTAQTLAAANSTRRGLTVQNISTGDLWINETGGTAAANGAGSFKLAADATANIDTNQAVSIVGATTGQKFSATEF
jgi:hypothetical protein